MGYMNKSLKRRMMESTDLNHAKRRVIGVKKVAKKMIGQEY